ncbi:hypothetical protein CDS [Bradyrhizobium sp. G22]|nr:hypothetical protein CDS [Bradyrhizobium sp.]CUT98349.1 hypothetical protein CDS [Bradyrhizobium sp. G22]
MVYKQGVKYRSRPSAGIVLLWCAMSLVGPKAKTFCTPHRSVAMGGPDIGIDRRF